MQRVSSTSIVGVIRLIPALCHRAPSTTHPGNKQIMNRVPTRVDNHPISGVHLPPSPPKKANGDEAWSNLFDGFLFVYGFFNFPISSNLSSVTFCGKRPFTFLQDDCDGKYDNALATFHPPKQCPASKAILGWIVQKNLNKNRFLPLHQILCLKAS